jgi:hypothetical protein
VAHIHLYIVAGQSNASGELTGRAEYLPPSDLDTSILFSWRSPGTSRTPKQEWGKLRPIHRDSGFNYFGPEVSLARRFAESGQKVAIFKYAKRSLSITAWGARGAGEHYDEMLKEFIYALKALRSSGDKVEVAGLFWIQGEADAETPDLANKYEGRLRALIRSFRSDIDEPIPVVLGLQEEHPGYSRERLAKVMKAQAEVAATEGAVARSTMQGLPWGDEHGHLCPEGIMQHGTRLFSDFLRLRSSLG